MKKTVVFLVVALLAVSALSAAWETGRTEGDLFYPEGNGFVSTTVAGTYSSSSSVQSSVAMVKITEVIETYYFPYVSWELDIHPGSLNFPMKEYNEDSTAVIRITAEDGSETIINTSNRFYGTYWNCIFTEDARLLTRVMLAHTKLAFEISIEGDTYRFTVDCSDYDRAFHSMYDQYVHDYPVDWHLVEYDEAALENQLDIKEFYEEMGYDITMAAGYYYYEDIITSRDHDYLITITLSSEDYEKNGYPYVDLDLTRVIRDDMFIYEDTGYYVSDDTLLLFAFVVDDKPYFLKTYNPMHVWQLKEDITDVIQAMRKSKNVSIRMVFLKAGIISCPIDGGKFAECYELAKEIPTI